MQNVSKKKKLTFLVLLKQYFNVLDSSQDLQESYVLEVADYIGRVYNQFTDQFYRKYLPKVLYDFVVIVAKQDLYKETITTGKTYFLKKNAVDVILTTGVYNLLQLCHE